MTTEVQRRLRHVWDERDVCVHCGNTREQVENEYIIGCRKPRFGDGAPGGFGGVNFVGPKLRREDQQDNEL